MSFRLPPPSVLLVALLLGAALSACAAPAGDARSPSMPRDLLTHVADDGSLVNGVFDPDPLVRITALRALGNVIPDDNTSLALKRVQNESDPEVLEALAFLAGRWRTPDAVDALTELLGHASPRIRAAALTGFAALQDDTRTILFVSALSDPSAEVRRAGALGLFRLDARREAFPRRVTEDVLVRRDVALTAAALTDADPGVRWRAVYALAGVRGRSGHEAVLRRALLDVASPLARVFALRGLGALADDGHGDPLETARELLGDDDARVALEAARIVTQRGAVAECVALLAHGASAHARLMAAETLVKRLAADVDGEHAPSAAAEAHEAHDASTARGDEASRAVDKASRPAVLAALREAASSDASARVRRECRAALAAAGDEAALRALVESSVVRDRERAARLLADGHLRDTVLVTDLLADPSSSVRAQVLAGLHDPAAYGEVLFLALRSDDPAVRGSAADALAPLLAEGRAPPDLVRAVAESLDTAEGWELDEARASLAAALGLPPLDPSPPTAPPEGPLLDALVAEARAARADPEPRVLLETSRGTLRLVLDRRLAPRHVASFLELVDAGFYDGLDIHRVVPNFVVQGLDPRGDGWGTGGRRVPDEFTPTPFLTGTVGMPHAGASHTGGCQIFITHLPTPHLDGLYTVFGRVDDGLDVLAALQVDDVIVSARRAATDTSPAAIDAAGDENSASPVTPGT